MDDPYEVLGVAKDADISEIRKAYKNLAVKLHPDKIGSNQRALEQMKLVNEAYALVKNKGIRESFDGADNWDKEASMEEREKVWREYSKQVEDYYDQVQVYLKEQITDIREQKEKLSSIEIELRKREEEISRREADICRQIEVINSFGAREMEISRREAFLAKKEKELQDLILHITRAYSLVVELDEASRGLKKLK